MSKEITKDQREFLKRAYAHRTEKVEGLAYSALALSLKANIPVFDLPYYILQRSRQVVEEAFAKVDFKNPALQKARMKFMKECLVELKKNLAFAEPKEVNDATDERDNRCEPLVKELVNLLLDENVIFSDEEYFKLVLTDEEKIPLESAIAGYSNALDEKMTMIISEHWSRAGKNLWGVEKEDVTFEMMDTVLKRNVDSSPE